MQKILLIQTAFIGDVILMTAALESAHAAYPTAQIDVVVRKGNEALLKGHPFIHTLHVWEKKKAKYRSLLQLLFSIRKEQYDAVINFQRFASSGMLTAFSGAKQRIGFSNNPLSWMFDLKALHQVGKKGDVDFLHEVERNRQMMALWSDVPAARPKLYPATADFDKIEPFATDRFITISPASVWETKRFPAEKWVELIQRSKCRVVLLGGPSDRSLCQEIASLAHGSLVQVLAGDLTMLQSAALMTKAEMNYVNDSGPLHLCSAMNAPVRAVFCSTIPEFGFGPLSDNGVVVQTRLDLDCRPCGLHGHKKCPQGHFKCAQSIQINDILAS
jgi:lipopolysaccharide heptosyltransferase II